MILGTPRCAIALQEEHSLVQQGNTNRFQLRRQSSRIVFRLYRDFLLEDDIAAIYLHSYILYRNSRLLATPQDSSLYGCRPA
jgi:hypothetical protein